jgi:Cu-Zn family superoxide dismutase
MALLAAVAIASTHNAATEITDLSNGEPVGTIMFTDTKYGLLVTPELSGLEPGLHAVHVHENPDCGDGNDGTPAGLAGDHYDPHGTGRHEGPYGEGHLGDLPNITVEADGSATVPVLAPRVAAADIVGRAVVLHRGADRYDRHSHHSHGKGGARMYCGVIR